MTTKKEKIAIFLNILFVVILFSGLIYWAENKPKKEYKEYVVKNKHCEVKFNNTAYYFLLDNGEIESVDLNEYMSKNVGDNIWR